MIQGTIIRVAGPVVDVKFTGGKLPALQEALTVTAEGTERTMEGAQHVTKCVRTEESWKLIISGMVNLVMEIGYLLSMMFS